MAEYKVFKKGKQMPSDSMARTDMLARVRDYTLRADEGKAWFKHRDPQKNSRPAARVRERVDALTRNAPIGSRILVQMDGIEDQLVIVKVEKGLPIVDVGAHPTIEKAYALLLGKYGEENVRSAGFWYCRAVAGTSIVSRHGYFGKDWKGAAVDVFGEGSMNTMAGITAMAKFLVSKAESGELNLYTVIVGDKRWRKGEGWGAYTGEYHTHIHVDVNAGKPCDP